MSKTLYTWAEVLAIYFKCTAREAAAMLVGLSSEDANTLANNAANQLGLITTDINRRGDDTAKLLEDDSKEDWRDVRAARDFRRD